MGWYSLEEGVEDFSEAGWMSSPLKNKKFLQQKLFFSSFMHHYISKWK